MNIRRSALIFVLVLVCFCCVGVAFAEGASSDPLSFDSAKRDLGIWSFVVFLGLMAILGKFAFGPIVNGLDAREKAVVDQITSAERANADAKAILVQYQRKLADSDEEVRQIIDAGKKDAERIGQSMIEKAREAAQLEQKRALQDIEAATMNAMQELAERSATLATELAGKIIRTKIDPKNHASLIETALKQFNTKS